jgi:hypothetical protein
MLLLASPVLAETAVALGIRQGIQAGLASTVRSRVFSGFFNKVLSESARNNTRIAGLLSSGGSKSELWSAISSTLSGLVKSKVWKVTTEALRHIVVDAYTSVIAMTDDEFRDLILALNDESDVLKLAEKIDLSTFADVVSNIQGLQYLVAAGIVMGVIGRLHNQVEMRQYVDKRLDFGNVVVNISNGDFQFVMNGKQMNVRTMQASPALFATLLIENYKRGDVYRDDLVTKAQDERIDEPDTDSDLLFERLSPRLDVYANMDPADAVFQRVVSHHV